MAYRRFIDAHVHYPQAAFDPTSSQIPDERQLEELLTMERALGCRRLCMLSTGNPPTHEAVARLIGEHPDFIIGFGYIRLGVDGPKVVDELRDMGFRGLKTISPTDNYDCKAYYPVYERAETLNMPMLFHTGQLFRAPGTGSREEDVSTARMMPWMLDPIARAFPKLTLIGAHLGSPSFAEAAWVARWNENVYWDLSGPITVRYGNRRVVHDMMYQAVAGAGITHKLVFGSDVTPPEIPDVVTAYDAFLDRLDADSLDKDQVFYGNMARILGIE